MNTQTNTHQFREEVYQSLEQRADAGLDLIDALTSAVVVESPVAISESPLFRRGFSSVYDFLKHGRMNKAQLRRTLYRHQPDGMECIAGYELYAVDCTEDEHPEADTLPDRHQTRKGKFAPKIIGHRYSWIARLGQWRTSWCLPQDVARVATDTTDSQVAAEQVQEVDRRSKRLKVVVADSLYGNTHFLTVFMLVSTIFALVRLRSNRVLYEEPPPHEGKRGRPHKHGAKFKLKEPHRPPDRHELFFLLGQTVRLQAWHNLHFYKLPFLVGLVLRVEFLRADGTPRYKRPLYLFWTGPTTTPLSELCRMYLWRFAIEHMFRFLKQHMGLSTSRSPNLAHNERWMWCCALAYAQLALMRHAVADQRPPWHPRHTQGQPKPMTPRQVQRVALSFLLVLGSPAQPTQPAGKGTGRPFGYHPQPRPRHPVVKKCKNKRRKR
ncbi:MAG: transposase [Ardenticatenaceae bacterium]|nr:transposase [Ardenticatenaceae bacterium]